MHSVEKTDDFQSVPPNAKVWELLTYRTKYEVSTQN